MPLVEVVAAPTHGPGAVVERAAAIVDGLGQDRRSACDGHAGLHRQPGQPAVHDRGPADPRGGRGDGRGRSTRRCAPPAIRWARSSSWTSPASTSTLAAATGIWERLGPAGPAPAVADPGGASSRPADLGRKTGEGSTVLRRTAGGSARPSSARPAARRGLSRGDDQRRGSSTRSPTRPVSPSARASRPPTTIDLAMRLGAGHP